MGDSTTRPILSLLLTHNVWATCGYTEDFVTVYTEVRYIEVSLYYFWVRKQWDYCYHILICQVKTIICSLRFTLTDLKMVNSKKCWFAADFAAVMSIQKTEVFPPLLGP